VSLDGKVGNGAVTADPDGALVMQQLLRHTGLTPAEQAYLDANGNHDGVFNVGDVQAWMSRHGGAPAASVRLPRQVRSP
jgi:hypothetical protein